jgi:hypothetical protein
MQHAERKQSLCRVGVGPRRQHDQNLDVHRNKETVKNSKRRWSIQVTDGPGGLSH